MIIPILHTKRTGRTDFLGSGIGDGSRGSNLPSDVLSGRFFPLCCCRGLGGREDEVAENRQGSREGGRGDGAASAAATVRKRRERGTKSEGNGNVEEEER